jgi:hypothetical protein
MTVQNSGALEAEINPAGTINVSQFNDALYSTALITVPTSGWSGSAPKFTRSIPVDGITSTSMPFVELKYPDNVTEEQKKAIDRAASKLVSLTTTNAGLVTLTATEVPTTSFQLMLRGLGSGQYTPDQSDIIYSVITKQEPYVERVGIDGLAKMELVGGTVAWNQLVQNGNFADGTDNWNSSTADASISASDGILIITKQSSYATGAIQHGNCIANHIYLCFADAKKVSGNNFSVRFMGESSGIAINSEDWITASKIVKPSSTSSNINLVYLRYASEDTGVGNARNVHIHDLTQMFGTAIADYVYSLEQSVEGSGIAWLQSYGFFTKDYYAYDAGSLQSVCTSARKITDLDGNERTYPIDDVQLRGLFKLDTNNKLYCNGDIYKSNGVVTRKYGIVDLGSLTWSASSLPVTGSTDLSNVIKAISDYTPANCICSKYLNVARNSLTDKTLAIRSNRNIVIQDSSFTGMTAEQVATALSGVYLVYELATETTETADPYVNPQRSLESGTEEFIDGLTRDVMVPVGNVTQYYQSEIIPIISEYIDAVMASN